MESSASADAPTRTQLEIWSDVACPWCYIGRRNLGIALADFDQRERPDITWRAYQLDPNIPDEGVDTDTYFADRFPDTSAFEEARGRLVLLGEELGIEFRFDRQRKVPNTLLAHRVISAAAREGVEEPVLDELFGAYFERGVDIGDADRLAELVRDAVVDPELADRILTAATDDESIASRVLDDIDQARTLGITGVPCFVADRRVAVPGAVPPSVLAQFLEDAVRHAEDIDDDDD